MAKLQGSFLWEMNRNCQKAIGEDPNLLSVQLVGYITYYSNLHRQHHVVTHPENPRRPLLQVSYGRERRILVSDAILYAKNIDIFGGSGHRDWLRIYWLD